MIRFNNFQIYTYVLCISSLFFCTTAQAQNNYKSQEIYSPNISSLGKYGDIPVALYTGIPNINIPLYTVRAGEISVPISLNYHAGGIKVNEVASWVGTGWNLCVGGFISRRIRGAADEGSDLGSGNYSQQGYYEGYGECVCFDLELDNYRTLENINGGKHDCEPDLFFFNIGEYSGSFFFDSYRQPHLNPMQDIKIDVKYLDHHFEEFILTTPDGLRYCFGEKMNDGNRPIETSTSLQQGNRGYSSTWLLTKIETSSGDDFVKFEYEKEKYSLHAWSESSAEVSMAKTYGFAVTETYRPYKLIENDITSYRMSKIYTKTENVIFEKSLDPRKDIDSQNSFCLEKIKINLPFNKRTDIQFKYHYSYSNMQDDETLHGYPYLPSGNFYRLYLDSISFDNNSRLTYSFLYDTNLLPNRLSFNFDHWGFYNGSKNTYSQCIPKVKSLSGEYIKIGALGEEANRNPQWPYMGYGMLKSIKYPTGGKTEFIYEPHDFYDKSPDDEFKLISDLDVGNPAITWETDIKSNEVKIEPNMKNKILFSYKISEDPSVDQGEIRLYLDSVLIRNYKLDSSNAELKVDSFDILPGNHIFRLHVSNAYGNIKCYQMCHSDGQNRIVGGTRIRGINNLLNNKIVSSKHFVYKEQNSDKSSGALAYTPQYIRSIANPTVGVFPIEVNTFVSKTGLAELYLASSNHILPMIDNRGSYISYGSVTELDEKEGKKVSVFYNSDNVYYNELISHKTYPSPPPVKNVEQGNLLEEKIYNKDTLIRNIKYKYETHYQNVKTASGSVVGSVYRPKEYCLAPWKESDLIYTMIKYVPVIGYSRLIEKSIENYMQNGVNSDTVLYAYSKKYINKIESEKKCLNKKYITKHYIYPKDLILEPSFISNLYESFVENCQLANRKYFDSGHSDLYIKEKNCLYNSYLERVKKELIDYRLSLEQYGSLLKGDLISVYDLCKNNVNSLIEEYSTMDNGLCSKLLSAWYYSYVPFNNSKQTNKPTTIFGLFSNKEIFNFQPIYKKDNILINDNRYSAYYHFEYKNDRILKQWKNGGSKTYFYYGYNNEYPIIKVETKDDICLEKIISNIKPNLELFLQDTIKDASEEMQKERWGDFNKKIREDLTLKKNMVTTYTYSPGLGISSLTDPMGITIFYRYDNWGRLIETYHYINKKNKIIKKYRYNYHCDNNL